MSKGTSESSTPPDLIALKARFESEAATVVDRIGWENLRVQWMGRKKGIVRSLMPHIRHVAPEDRKAFGQGVNQLKNQVESTLESLDTDLTNQEAVRAIPSIDVTLPGRRPELGTEHPVIRVMAEIETIFAEMGYRVAEGPEIESDFHNFEALNIPESHPARDEQDTFFIADGGGDVLRTHTSPVQIRTMLQRKPPIRIICPGRVYRKDNDLRHSPMFHQIECLCVDRGITFGHLKGTLEAFLHRLFSPETGIRLRPSFFPFTEPSAEVDITCPFCTGGGCQVCSQTGWMEILGSGMVDPRVLRQCGIDPKVYSGFAFGLGIDRVAMIRYGIPNIRMLFDNDERLLRQIRN